MDSGLFSKQLCRDILEIVQQEKEWNLNQILIEAVKRNKQTGSSTEKLAKFDGNNLMKTTNLGDSGYVIYTANRTDGLSDEGVVLYLNNLHHATYNF